MKMPDEKKENRKSPNKKKNQHKKKSLVEHIRYFHVFIVIMLYQTDHYLEILR